MTLVIDNLMKREWVVRQRRHDDRRFCLTDAGVALIEAIMPAHVAYVTASMSVLSAAEQTQLAALCRKPGLAQAHGGNV